MNRKEYLKYTIGYILGITFFMFVIPGLIFCASYFTASLVKLFIFNDDRIGAVLSLLICLPGVTFMIWSNIVLFNIGKGGPAEGFGIEISPKTKVLVTKGPYRYTRNPMAFGAYSMYMSLALLYNSYAALILVVLFLPVIIVYLKKSEEKRLVKDFGEDYLNYRERVSLFIPLPPKK